MTSLHRQGLLKLDDRRRERSEYLAFGLELMDANLTIEEQSELDATSLEALNGARSLQEGTVHVHTQ